MDPVKRKLTFVAPGTLNKSKCKFIPRFIPRVGNGGGPCDIAGSSKSVLAPKCDQKHDEAATPASQKNEVNKRTRSSFLPGFSSKDGIGGATFSVSTGTSKEMDNDISLGHRGLVKKSITPNFLPRVAPTDRSTRSSGRKNPSNSSVLNFDGADFIASCLNPEFVSKIEALQASINDSETREDGEKSTTHTPLLPDRNPSKSSVLNFDGADFIASCLNPEFVSKLEALQASIKDSETHGDGEKSTAHTPDKIISPTIDKNTNVRSLSTENGSDDTADDESEYVGYDTVAVRKRKKVAADAKTRGVNKCPRVARLEDKEKLQVVFYDNCPVGKNGKEMVRHMGRIVRDRWTVPVRVHSWDEFSPSVLNHMWESVTNKFDSEHMDLHREATLDHMKRLWQNWRGLLMRDHIIKKKSTSDALKHVPNHLRKDDWEWLVKEHFMSAEFKKVSERNSENRSGQTMRPRKGSKPFKEVIWSELGGKDGKQPSISEVFKATRMKKDGSLDNDVASKYKEIVEVEEDETLTPFDVVEKCFGDQDRSHVVCFGYGTKPKDVRGPLRSREELTCKLRDTEKENKELRNRMLKMDEDRKKELQMYDEKVKNLEEMTMENKQKNAEMEKKLQFLIARAIEYQGREDLL